VIAMHPLPRSALRGADATLASTPPSASTNLHRRPTARNRLPRPSGRGDDARAGRKSCDHLPHDALSSADLFGVFVAVVLALAGDAQSDDDAPKGSITRRDPRRQRGRRRACRGRRRRSSRAPGRGTATRTTGADGTAKFPGVPSKDVTFVARLAGRFPAWQTPGAPVWGRNPEDDDPDGDGVTKGSAAPRARDGLRGQGVSFDDGRAGRRREGRSVGARLRVGHPRASRGADLDGGVGRVGQVPDRPSLAQGRRPEARGTRRARHRAQQGHGVSETIEVKVRASGVYAPVTFRLAARELAPRQGDRDGRTTGRSTSPSTRIRRTSASSQEDPRTRAPTRTRTRACSTCEPTRTARTRCRSFSPA